MKFKECIEFATANPVCYFATTDGDQPRVRGMLMWYADETGFYFITFSLKPFAKQLKANPRVEVCFYNNPPSLQTAKQMRVTGVAESVADPAVLERAYESRKFLEGIAGQPLLPLTEVIRIKSGDAHFWTMMDVLKEPTLEHIQF